MKKKINNNNKNHNNNNDDDLTMMTMMTKNDNDGDTDDCYDCIIDDIDNDFVHLIHSSWYHEKTTFFAI